MTITFACQCAPLTVSDVGDTPPVCRCGERRISDVKAPAPRFRGVCQGPSATYTHAEPAIVNVAPAGPLRVKGPTNAAR